MITFSRTGCAVIDSLFLEIRRSKPQNSGLGCLWVVTLL